MRDLDRRALQGVRVLVGRQAVLHLFALTAGVFVARSMGPGPIGVYGIALFVVNVLALIADPGLRTAMIRPHAVGLPTWAAAVGCACGLWFCVLAVAGEDLVRLIYSEEWLPALPVLLIFSASGMLASVRWFTTSALLALGRATFTARVTTVTAIISVIASVLLVVRIGFLGVPIGQFLGIVIATPWLLRGLGPTTPARVLRQTVGVFVPMALAGAAGAAALQVPADPASRGLLAAAVVTVVFGAAAWWTGPHWLRARVREELAHPVVLLSRSAAP